jgi:hypothetical protein
MDELVLEYKQMGLRGKAWVRVTDHIRGAGPSNDLKNGRHLSEQDGIIAVKFGRKIRIYKRVRYGVDSTHDYVKLLMVIS